MNGPSVSIITELHEVVAQCGNVLRGVVFVGGKEFRIETDLEKTRIQIIDSAYCCETGEIDADGDVITQAGECVTQEWHADDWTALTAFVAA
jgi:hypothetical protein